MTNFYDIHTYEPKNTDSFFFDNNVWIFLFCPIGDYDKKQQQIYSAFLHQVIQANATIYINSLILSEFCNRYLRFDFGAWKNEMRIPKADYKRDFIRSERYRETTVTLSMLIKQIMRLTALEKIQDGFNSINIDFICNHLQAIDFNDSYYIELCKKNGLILVTNDKDFRKVSDPELTIIS